MVDRTASAAASDDYDIHPHHHPEYKTASAAAPYTAIYTVSITRSTNIKRQ